MEDKLKQRLDQVECLCELKDKIRISENQIDVISNLKEDKKDPYFGFSLQIHGSSNLTSEHLLFKCNSKETLLSILSHIETDILLNQETKKQEFDTLFQEVFNEKP
ncbi:hypothetical protein [Leptospira harrisiae]|uniref:hypothetical protein n=1 Tax=Leptospira harrisiae TaxID=2023189 RepID=UPI000F63E258|nr:hypothetical protein [Leptospira harrisiae]